MQNKADVVGRPIEVPDVEEATPLGAAILAGIGVGLYRGRRGRLPARLPTRQDLRARRRTCSAQYAEWFPIYRDLYPATETREPSTV